MNVTRLLLVCLTPSYLCARADRDTPLANPPATVPPIVLQGQLDNQLSEAILAGDMGTVKKAISSGADVSHMDSDGKTPVWLALILGNFEAVLELLESGAKSDVVYRGKSFAQVFFDEASVSSVLHIKILRLLATNRVDFNQVTKKVGNGSIIDFAIQALDASEKDPGLKTEALRLVQDVQQFANVQSVYLQYYGIPQALWFTGNCYFYSEPSVIDICVKAGMDINKSKALWIRRARIDDKRSGHVHIGLSFYYSRLRAIEGTHHPLYQPLKPMPALFIAIKANSKRDADIFDPQYSSKAVEVLLDHGADINLVENPDGTGQQTPLDWALSNGSSDAIRILLKRGAKTYKQLQSQ